ncbi:MAG: LysE family transporter [Ignavibacteriales bacterium]|nr:LysE family transporter [Ignavibacteriales bacterium]
MLESIFIGCGFAFAAAVQPGPLQAFLFSSVARKGWKRTLPASFSPLLSDGPIALLVLLLLNNIPASMRGVLQCAGGILLLYFAWASYRQWKKKTEPQDNIKDSAPRTLIQAATVNILNPNPYLGWSLVLGPAVLSAWNKSPLHAVVLVFAFYITMVSTLASTIILFGTSRFLSIKGKHALILISSVILALMGVYQMLIIIFRSSAT